MMKCMPLIITSKSVKTRAGKLGFRTKFSFQFTGQLSALPFLMHFYLVICTFICLFVYFIITVSIIIFFLCVLISLFIYIF